MKNKNKIVIILVVVVLVAITLFGVKFLSSRIGIEGTGAVVSKDDNKTEVERNYTIICVQEQYAKNYRDCKYWSETGEKRDSLIKLTDEAVNSFCTELLKIFSNCK